MPTHEEWPTEKTTAVRPAPPVEPAPPFSPPPGTTVPPPGRGPDDGIGWGFLIGILIAVVIGGIVAAVLLTRHHHKAAATTTTVVRTAPGTTTGLTPATTAVTPTTSVKATTTTTVATTTTTASSPSTTTAAAPAKPTTVSVPDVGAGSGKVQGAVDRLNSAGLLVTLAYVPNELPLGTVVAQSPKSGGSAPSGSHVTLNLSSGKDGTASNAVPSVTGKTIPQAVAAVKAAGLRMMFVKKPVTDRSQAGTVVAQTPAPGTRIPAHGEVLVYMGAAR